MVITWELVWISQSTRIAEIHNQGISGNERQALLWEITERVTTDDLLANNFSKFCIEK